jgi:hypothetical protein
LHRIQAEQHEARRHDRQDRQHEHGAPDRSGRNEETGDDDDRQEHEQHRDAGQGANRVLFHLRLSPPGMGARK